jgi:hypothetical protein
MKTKDENNKLEVKQFPAIQRNLTKNNTTAEILGHQ